MLEKTLESPLYCMEIKPVNPKGNQSWIFIARTEVEAETPIRPPDVKNWLIGKDPDAGEDWRQEKGMTEDEMARRHHWLNGREFEWTPGVGDGQGGLACCNSWGRNESDMTERLTSTELNSSYVWMWELDHKEGWAPKSWCFWNVVLEKTLESPLYCMEIKLVNPEGNQS